MRTVVISVLSQPWHVKQSIGAGALGHVSKDATAEEIIDAVKAAAAGTFHITPALARMLIVGDDATHPDLSRQEIRALTLYAADLPMKSVARQMGISVHTAKCYIDRVREKYTKAGRYTRSKLELRRRAVEDHLVTDRE
ncbi:LuxR C-terminal-related transcriptional regulator [Saccharothrix sp. Mg75]|uniref:LuxR C-terminal-related transcriptional regulator n=1 Tax=Saccharothrix sp. Mg75 TaxID=3445357 RepID=UPI003EEAC645